MSQVPRLAIVASHPIQYQSPLFRRLAERGRVQPTLLYLTRHGVEPTFDRGFRRAVRFDVDLLHGLEHRFVPNRSPRADVSTFVGLLNPALLTLINRRNCDAVLVHGHGSLSAWLSIASAYGRGLPYLLRGESQPLSVGASRMRRARRRVVAPVVTNAAACLAIGQRNADFYRSHGASEDRIVAVPYCVDNDLFATEGEKGRADRASTLAALDLDPDLPTLLYAAKLIARKRPLDLLAAHCGMARAANLVVVGDGELYDEVAGRSAHRDRVRLLGFRNQHELARWYGAADVFVLPSAFETWGLAVNEAMAAGAVPVVSDVVGCAPDLVTSASGRTFPVGDVTRLAAVLDELAGDPALLARLRTGGKRLIDRHSLDAAAEGIEAAVELALALAKPPR